MIGKHSSNTYYFKGDLDNIEIYNEIVESHIPTTSIALNPSTIDILQGETSTLTPIFEPLDATNQNLTWTSNDESIATVVNGVVTASSTATGTVTITATTTDGTNLSATCTVNVLPKPKTRAKLTITMSNGLDKEYDLSSTEVYSFINWYDNKSNGIGSSYYTFTKTISVAPFIKIKQYVIFDKIVSFDVAEYNEI